MGFFDFKDKFFKRKKVITETEEMKKKRLELEESRIKTKEIERTLEQRKLNEKLIRTSYQNLCEHKSLSLPKNTSNPSSNFTDYTAKCDYCAAQVWNKQRLNNYIYNIIGLLGKMPKLVESLKLSDELVNENDFNLVNKSLDLISDLSEIKERLSKLSDTEFNANIINKLSSNDIKEMANNNNNENPIENNNILD